MRRKFVLAMSAIALAFALIGCPDNGTTTPVIERFYGTAGGVTYVLIITDGSSFELRVGNEISTGTATLSGGTWTLTPTGGQAFT